MWRHVFLTYTCCITFFLTCLSFLSINSFVSWSLFTFSNFSRKRAACSWKSIGVHFRIMSIRCVLGINVWCMLTSRFCAALSRACLASNRWRDLPDERRSLPKIKFVDVKLTYFCVCSTYKPPWFVVVDHSCENDLTVCTYIELSANDMLSDSVLASDWLLRDCISLSCLDTGLYEL